jgi:uncharacterized protein
MDLMTTAFLAGAGVIAGIIAMMVGGAAVVIYPALIATGVPPQLRLSPISLRLCLRPCWRHCVTARNCRFSIAFVGLIVASIAGAGLGAALLVLTSERMFTQIVPLLLGFARCCSPIPSGSAAGFARAPRGVAMPSRSISPV